MISGEDVCSSVVFGTLVGVFVFSVMWSLSYVVISVRVRESGVCVHISGDECVWYECDVLYAVLYALVSKFVVR